jgi:glycosyltransferase involved in cell wall biosynthesis
VKILLLNYEFPPVGGGAGMATYSLARALAELGQDVDVLTSGGRGDPAIERIDGFNVYRALSLRKSVHDCGLRGAATYMGFALPKLVRLVYSKCYDVHHYFFGIPTGLFSCLRLGRNIRPYVVSLRGSDVPGYDPFNRKVEFLHRGLKPLTRLIWFRAKHVVAVTNSLKQLALETAPGMDIKVIPNGIDTDLFRPLKTESKDPSKFNLICVARLVRRKGIENILAAISRLRSNDIKLSIVGTGEYRHVLERRCHELGLEAIVQFKGFCRRELLPNLYAQSDAFILTSYSEAFGNVFAEAMACGLPVIGSDIGGIPDLIKEDTGILVPPDDIDAIVRAILRLQHSKPLCGRMGHSCRERIMQEYQWAHIARRFLALYAS